MHGIIKCQEVIIVFEIENSLMLNLIKMSPKKWFRDNDYHNLLRTIDDSKMLRGFNIDGCRCRRGQTGPNFAVIGPPCSQTRRHGLLLVVFFRLDARRIFSRWLDWFLPSRQ